MTEGLKGPLHSQNKVLNLGKVTGRMTQQYNLAGRLKTYHVEKSLYVRLLPVSFIRLLINYCQLFAI